MTHKLESIGFKPSQFTVGETSLTLKNVGLYKGRSIGFEVFLLQSNGEKIKLNPETLQELGARVHDLCMGAFQAAALRMQPENLDELVLVSNPEQTNIINQKTHAGLPFKGSQIHSDAQILRTSLIAAQKIEPPTSLVAVPTEAPVASKSSFGRYLTYALATGAIAAGGGAYSLANPEQRKMFCEMVKTFGQIGRSKVSSAPIFKWPTSYEIGKAVLRKGGEEAWNSLKKGSFLNRRSAMAAFALAALYTAYRRK